MSDLIATALGCVVGAVVVLAARWAPIQHARETVQRIVAPAVGVVSGMSVARLEAGVVAQLVAVVLAMIGAMLIGRKLEQRTHDRNKRAALRIMQEERERAG